MQSERESIQSGAVFIFSEQDSGMRRWTDGMRWSKSRVEGQFLVYRRLPQDQSPPSQKRRRNASPSQDYKNSDNGSYGKQKRDSDEEGFGMAAAAGDYVLCKKTFAISLAGNVTHVVQRFDTDLLLHET